MSVAAAWYLFGWALVPMARPMALVIALAGGIAFVYRPAVVLGYAAALGVTVSGLLVALVVGFWASFGVYLPPEVAVGITMALIALSLLGSLWFGAAMSGSGVGPVSGAPARLEESIEVVRSRLQPLEAKALQFTVIGGVVLVVVLAVIMGMTGSTASQAGPFLVVMLPAAAVGSWVLLRMALAAWARGVTKFYMVALAISAWVASLVRAALQPILVLAHFPKAICDTCLLWSEPLVSTYDTGVRTCEKCSGVITFEGGPGRLVALVGDEPAPAHLPQRVFVRSSKEIAAWEGRLDITHVRLPAKLENVHDFESLVTWLLNEPPSQGLRKVSVYSPVPRLQLPPNVRNLIDNKLAWTESDPLR